MANRRAPLYHVGVKPPPITVDEARRRLAAETPSPLEEEVALLDAAGAVLAEDVVSDLCMPPFDRAMMDGYALIASDTPGELDVIDEIPAGRRSSKVVERGRCAKIMTGAPLPQGADAVQQVEKTSAAGPRVRILEAVRPGQNVAPRAGELREGETVLRRGHSVRPVEIAVLATVGRTRVRVYRRPRCAMFSTGDELVEPSVRPGPGQIRNSNTYAVAAQLRTMGLSCDILPIARDDLHELRARIRDGLSRDVLIISGGVSAGDWDLVVPALQAEGVSAALHQVQIKPGRPFFFGRRGRTVAFGLPGNPVSSFVTFEVFVRPFLGRMMGADTTRRHARARLTEALPKTVDRAQYMPAVVTDEPDGPRVRPLPWRGSADIFTVTRANALAIQPPATACRAGDIVEVMLL
ncbi:MAG: molybdopterin molybdotransferase MoeA [Planctomycetes bacterium]|nr:molybdopterin molybdotransferase MoeA [Planctomycetota bacterium]